MEKGIMEELKDDKFNVKKFLFLFKKLFPIRDIDENSKKEIQLVAKALKNTPAVYIIERIYYDQLSYFSKLFFLNDFDITRALYHENKNKNIKACLEQYNYVLNKIHHFYQICLENVKLVDPSKGFMIRVEHRIHSLISHFSQGLEDINYLYYSQSFKIFSLLYYHKIAKVQKIRETVNKDYQLSKEECVLFVIPELNNFKVCIDTWDQSEFYTEYLNGEEEDEEEEEGYNDIDMIYEDDENIINEDNSKEVSSSPSLNRGGDDDHKEKIEGNPSEMEDIEMKDQEMIDDEEEGEDNNNNNDDENDSSSDSEGEMEPEIEYKGNIWEDAELEMGEGEHDNDGDLDISKHELLNDNDNLIAAHNHIRKFVINSAHTLADNFLYRYEYIISAVLNRYVKAHIYNNYKGIFNEPLLVRSISWLNCLTIPFQRLIWQPDLNPDSVKSFNSWNSRINFLIYRTYFDLRTSELFDIIVEYPDSKWALIDLKISIKKTGLIKELISTLNYSIEKRLLHQGAKTSDIVHQYISLIKSMQILDSSGLLLEQISDPIKKYLRDREDTIKCIIQIIVDDNNNDLLEGISKNDITTLEDMNIDNYNNDNWMPELLEIDPANEAVKRKSVDIISTLLNIYDSKDIFIKEFQELLANRLLALKSYDSKRELKNVELLKLRFGESSLQLCEVMVKDISSSRRIDYNIHTDPDSSLDHDKDKGKEEEGHKKEKEEEPNNDSLPLHAKILSHLFWPPFKANNLKFPKEIQKYADIYSKKYTTLKPSRKLQWLPYLGNVSLTVELEDRTLTFDDLTPLQAIILYHFQKKDQWELDELSNELEVTSVLVKRAISYWVSNGVMKEISKNVFKILETEEEIVVDVDNEEQTHAIEEVDDSSTLQNAKEQEMEKMRIYWTFISNMVTNLGGMTIERIHQMLQVCLPDYKSQIEKLESFLELMVQENKLEVNGDIYTIKK